MGLGCEISDRVHRVLPDDFLPLDIISMTTVSRFQIKGSSHQHGTPARPGTRLGLILVNVTTQPDLNSSFAEQRTGIPQPLQDLLSGSVILQPSTAPLKNKILSVCEKLAKGKSLKHKSCCSSRGSVIKGRSRNVKLGGGVCSPRCFLKGVTSSYCMQGQSLLLSNPVLMHSDPIHLTASGD